MTFFFFFFLEEKLIPGSVRPDSVKLNLEPSVMKSIQRGSDEEMTIVAFQELEKFLKNHVVVIQITLKAQCVKVKNYVAMYVFTKL